MRARNHTDFRNARVLAPTYRYLHTLSALRTLLLLSAPVSSVGCRMQTLTNHELSLLKTGYTYKYFDRIAKMRSNLSIVGCTRCT